MPASGDVYQVKVVGTLNGQLYNNVFWYRMYIYDDTVAIPASPLVARFGGLGWVLLVDGLGDALDIEYIQAINWNDLDDFSQQSSTAWDGQQVGADVCPSSVCLTFQSAAPTPGKFYSYKRIGGIPTARVDGNVITDTTTPSYQPFADFLSDDISDSGSDCAWEPVQVKHSQTTAPFSKESPYTMPVMGSGNPIVARVLDGPWSWGLGTQNSRKPGYGD